MADSSGQAEIRGIDIDKLAKGFADEEFIMKRYCTVTPTSAREIRWYQKTAGILTPTAPAVIANVAEGARPFVLEQSWTRTTSYVRKYFIESPMLTDEDIRDSDIDILATNVRDLVRAVAYQVDSRIFTVASTGTGVNAITSSGAWSTPNQTLIDPIRDIMNAKTAIRNYNYNPEGAVLIITPTQHSNLLQWLISYKGSSIPAFTSQKVESGVVMELLGVRVLVSTFAAASGAALIVPQRAVTWKTFMPITARNVEEVGIGTKIRVWEEGEALLTDPKAAAYITVV